MKYTREQILAMDAEQLRLAIAEAKGLDISEHDEHDWKREPGGDIDLYAYSNDPHSGPYCNRCGYSFCTGCSGDDGYDNGLPCKSYPPYWTEHMNAAWELVEEVPPDKWFVSVDRDHTRWMCFFGSNVSSEDEYYQGEGDTAPLAICRAYLLWKEGV